MNFNEINNAIEKVFSDNIDLYEKLFSLNVEEGEKFQIGKFNIELVNETSIAIYYKDEIEGLFYLENKDGFMISNLIPSFGILWKDNKVTNKLTLDTLKLFMIVMDKLRKEINNDN